MLWKRSWAETANALQRASSALAGSLTPDCWEDEFVLVLPVNGIGRKAASEGVVESGPQGVHIGIGPLPAMAGILFPGSVAVLEDHIQAAALVTQAVAGSAEIQQLNSTIVGNIDIVRVTSRWITPLECTEAKAPMTGSRCAWSPAKRGGHAASGSPEAGALDVP